MAVFHCFHHQRQEDADGVGYRVIDGHEYCTDSAPEAGYDFREGEYTKADNAADRADEYNDERKMRDLEDRQ